MIRKLSIALTAAAAAAATLGAGALAYAADPAAWTIGPVIRGKNYSVNMPLRPLPMNGGFAIDFPYPNKAAGHVHYVTFPTGSLAGKREIEMRFRIDAAPGTRFVPQEYPQHEPLISLYFQRRGDNWSAAGDYAFYRWYSMPVATLEPGSGDYVLRVPLTDVEAWTSVSRPKGYDKQAQFTQALRDTGEVGFVLGSRGGRGHGIYATGPARMMVTRFEIR